MLRKKYWDVVITEFFIVRLEQEPPFGGSCVLTILSFSGRLPPVCTGGFMRKDFEKSVLLCDLGRVAVSFDNDRCCRQLSELTGGRHPPGAITLLSGDDWTSYRSGRYNDVQFYCIVRERLDLSRAEVTDEMIGQAIGDVFTPIQETIAILRELRAYGKRLVAVSDTEPPRVRQLIKMGILGPNGLFHDEVLSCDPLVRRLKPDPDIYKFALRVAGVRPAQALFTDDLTVNCAGAQALGIEAHVFTDPSGLRDFLVCHRMLP